MSSGGPLRLLSPIGQRLIFSHVWKNSFKIDALPQTSQAVMAVFELLSKKISSGEIEDVRHALPEELRNLWPEPYVAAGTVR